MVPVGNPGAHRRLLEQWWGHYAKPPGLLDAKPDYPPMVEDYLTANLARRLVLPLPPRRQMPSAKVDLGREIGLTLGTETIVMEMLQDRVLGLNELAQPADQPLPEPASVGEADGSRGGQRTFAVEPIANRVPVECFYARFGRFNNFLWLQDTLAKWGGDAQNLIALRGLDRGMRRRIERQLVLKTDRALAHAGRNGDRRRGAGRHRHVFPRRAPPTDCSSMPETTSRSAPA